MKKKEIFFKNYIKSTNIFFRKKIEIIEEQIDIAKISQENVEKLVFNFDKIDSINRAVADQIKKMEKKIVSNNIQVEYINVNDSINKMFDSLFKIKQKKILPYKIINFDNL
ncbi:MAG: hypothetical protein WC002_03560 [Candidatus Muiribacteriota bacterium]|jgi:MFS superfamily sulfate permease-like transporter